MATVSWKNPGTSGNWDSAANWTGLPGDETFPGQVPADADAVTLNSGVSATDYVVTFNVTSASLDSLSVASSTATTTLQMTTGDTLIANVVELVDPRSTIDGAGTISAGDLIGNIGTIEAGTASTGGTLDLTGAGVLASFGTGDLAIGDAAPTTLEFDLAGGADTASAISITNANQTLEVGSKLTIDEQQNVTLGTIKMTGGSITDKKNITFGTGTSNGSLSGFGTVDAGLTRSGSGTADTITATGGTLTLVRAVAASSGLVFDIDNSAASSLQLNTAPGTGNTFTFLGSAGDLATTKGVVVNTNIAGMNVGSSGTVPTNFFDILGTSGVTVTSGGTGLGTSGNVTLSDGDTLNLTDITNTSGIWHVLAVPDAAGDGTDVFLSTVCYVAGTHILTATGERAIESLSQGDIVLTLSDGEMKAHPVKWLGQRRIDLTAHPQPETVAPIRIERDAFADGMPHRDLLVSPDHAIFVDGMLICARQLVNGTTIRQERGSRAVHYCHIELDQHAILLAEGLPAESYLDTGNSGFFANSEAPMVLHPDLTDETDYPTREAGSCAPFVSDEASVQPVWQRLADRAAVIGQAVTQRVTTTEANLRLLADRRTLKPVFSDSDRVIFVLPRGAREVRLVSRAQSPTEARPWLDDRRHLGVRVKRIVMRSAGEMREVPMDHPDLARGWWAVEQDGPMMSRWTDGEAVLPLPRR